MTLLTKTLNRHIFRNQYIFKINISHNYISCRISLQDVKLLMTSSSNAYTFIYAIHIVYLLYIRAYIVYIYMYKVHQIKTQVYIYIYI